jgi:hypothetical protein
MQASFDSPANGSGMSLGGGTGLQGEREGWGDYDVAAMAEMKR